MMRRRKSDRSRWSDPRFWHEDWYRPQAYQRYRPMGWRAGFVMLAVGILLAVLINAIADRVSPRNITPVSEGNP